MNKINSSISLFVLVLFVLACSKDPVIVKHNLEAPVLPETLFDYVNAEQNLPSLVGDNTPDDNRMSNAGATLGRVLFYDTQLSINNGVACASCHKQELAFTDGVQFSTGFEGKLTTRNSPTVMNMRFSKNFFWDMSQDDLETQVVVPIGNHIEMGMEDTDYLSEKLSQIEYYPELFRNAFGTELISHERISEALAQFLRSVNSFESKFDISRANDFEDFTPLESLGQEVFIKSNCNSCHTVMSNAFLGENGEIEIGNHSPSPYTGGSTSSTSFANIGLDLVYEDQGRGEGAFKIPSLRNLVFTAPYMHDGRFASLDEVIEHYNSGVKDHEALHHSLKSPDGSVMRLNLTSVEKTALKAFLLTLTDEHLLNDEKLSDPFRS